MSKKITLLFVFVLLVISGCSGKEVPRDELVVAISNSPQTLDPRLATDSYAMKIKHLIFNGLLKRDKNMELTNDLADRHEMLSPLHFRFYLKKGVRFHDGHELTSEDVIYTYQSILDDKLVSPFRGEVSKIKNISAIDKYTVEFKLKEKYAPIYTVFTYQIVPRLSGKELNDHPVGTGPYKFVSYKTDEKLKLESFSEYFGDKAKSKFITFKIVKDDNARVMELIRGGIDLTINGVPLLLLSKVTDEKNLDMLSDDGLSFYYLNINLKDSVLSKKKVRQAIAYAINRDELIEYKMKNMVYKADSMLSPIHWAYAKGLFSYEYDPDKAIKLLNGEKFKLTIKTSTNKERLAIVLLIAEQLKKVGIDANVQAFEWGTYYRDIKSGNFQLASSMWVGVTEPDMYYNVFASDEFPPDGLNRGYYFNKTVDRLSKLAREEMDQQKRRKYYEEIQKIVQDELPYINMWHEKNIVVYNKRLKGVTVLPHASYYNLAEIYKK